MLQSKLDAMDFTYKQGMGTDAVSAISPESRKRLDALQGISDGGGKDAAASAWLKANGAPDTPANRAAWIARNK